MPTPRLPMRKIREVLRLKHDQGLSHRAVARACSLGVGTVTLYLQRATDRGVSWPVPAELDDAVLEARATAIDLAVQERATQVPGSAGMPAARDERARTWWPASARCPSVRRSCQVFDVNRYASVSHHPIS